MRHFFPRSFFYTESIMFIHMFVLTKYGFRAYMQKIHKRSTSHLLRENENAKKTNKKNKGGGQRLRAETPIFGS